MSACPRCGQALQADAQVCRHCLHVLDREAWQRHDAGRLGADSRGGGRPLEDLPVGPLPLTGGASAVGLAGSALRLIGVATLLQRRRKRRRDLAP
jgi:hypothetical protein